MKKVNYLTNDELNYWVAKAQAWKLDSEGKWLLDGELMHFAEHYHPSTCWEQASELLLKCRNVSLFEDTRTYDRKTGEPRECIEGWGLHCKDSDVDSFSRTPHRAICKAFVMSVYGDEVENLPSHYSL